MGTTPRGYRYPENTDPATVPDDMMDALTDVDTDVAGIDGSLTTEKAKITTLELEMDTVEALAAANDTRSRKNQADITALVQKVSTQRGLHNINDLPPLGSGDSYATSVTFPTPFTSDPPFVLLEQSSLASGQQWLRLVPYNLTISGFDIYIYNLFSQTQNLGQLQVFWIAFGNMA